MRLVTLVRAAAAIALVLLAGWAATAPSGGQPEEQPPALPTSRSVVLGRSVEGRIVRARRIGERESPRRALVVGSIHGDERGGEAVTSALRSLSGVRGVDLWVVETVNPDGRVRRDRRNARGVDLNRNFPHRWRRTGPRGSRYYAGRRPLSEPESRLVREWILRLRPQVTIWYHQPWGVVLVPCRGRGTVERRYARLARSPIERCGRGRGLTGTATAWQRATLPGTTAFVVELAGGRVARRTALRHARAAATVARESAVP